MACDKRVMAFEQAPIRVWMVRDESLRDSCILSGFFGCNVIYCL